jgi:hypothetical protein
MHTTCRCHAPRRIKYHPAEIKTVLTKLREALIAGRSEIWSIDNAQRPIAGSECKANGPTFNVNAGRLLSSDAYLWRAKFGENGCRRILNTDWFRQPASTLKFGTALSKRNVKQAILPASIRRATEHFEGQAGLPASCRFRLTVIRPD